MDRKTYARKVLQEVLGFQSALRATLYRYTHNIADVDEMYQEVLLRLYIAAEQGSHVSDDIRSIRAYAITMARNVALDFIRHRKIVDIEYVDPEALGEMHDVGADLEEELSIEQDVTRLLEAMEELPPRCRMVYLMMRILGATQKEVAGTLEISENTVEQHMRKASRALAGLIGEVQHRYTRGGSQIMRLVGKKAG